MSGIPPHPGNTGPIDYSVQNEAFRIIYVFEALAAVFVFLRVWSRFLLARGSWTGLMMWSDLCLGIAFLLSIGECVALATVTKRGNTGLHLMDILRLPPPSLDYQVTTNKWMLANQLLYNPILGFVKASVLFLFLRLGGNKRHVRLSCYGLMAFNFALMIATFIADALQCQPFHYFFDMPKMDLNAQEAAGADPVTGLKNGVKITGGKCFHQTNFVLATAGLNIFTDILVMAIPIAMVWGLQMKTKKKVIVVSILSMGIAVTAVGVARLPLMYHMLDPKNPDPTYTMGFTTSAMETGLAIATACVPDLAPLLSRFFPSLFSTAYAPNSYPSRPTRQGYTNNNNNNGSKLAYAKEHTHVSVTRRSTDGGNSSEGETYAMHTWRSNNGMGHVTDIKGGAAAGSTNGSQERIVSVGKPGGIVKTTQFVMHDDDDEDGKRWSAV